MDRRITLVIPLIFCVISNGAQPLPNFMGREIRITDPGTDDQGFEPKGPASVCIEGPPQRQCYTAPERYGRNPAVDLIYLDRNTAAILFRADSGGVSGWSTHFALLQPGAGKDLKDIFFSKVTISNQSQHAFWEDPTISQAPIFVTADFVWGPDEGHYGEHRYIVAVYVKKRSDYYYLEDQYMTANQYDLEKTEILRSEKPEILARLRRLKTKR